jgi:hypothetical protein
MLFSEGARYLIFDKFRQINDFGGCNRLDGLV